MNTILAVDLGGSGMKAALFGDDGAILAEASAALAFDEDGSGRSEADVGRWWAALGEVAERLGAEADLAAVTAVAVCGLTRTQVLLDGDGAVLRPAIGFRDARAGDVLREALAGVDHPGTAGLNPFHPLARLLWVRAHEPSTWAATRLVLEPKDAINFALTGTARSDAISMHQLLGVMRGDDPLGPRLGIASSILPPIGTPTDVVGTVRPGLPGALGRLAGARVLSGSNDTWTAVAGLGALTPGRAYCISGSSEVFGLIADRAAPAEGLITLPWGAGMWQIGGPGQNGANALAFIVDRLAPGEAPFADRLAALLAQPVSPEPLLFLPFLHGERVPHWDADLRAAFVGLSASHGPGDMVRAVMEGVAFVNRTVLGRAEAATGCRADEVRIAGGGALSDTWSQIRADVLGRPVRTFGGREMGLAGAFAIARVGLGLAPSLAAAADRSGDSTLFAPSPEAMRRADALFPLFGKAHDRLADLSRRLARFDDAR